MRRQVQVFLILLTLAALSARADTGAPVFEKDILPIFTEYCFTCHGQSSPKLGLDLRRAVTTLRGSQNGPVIVKGSPEQSVLFQKVSAHTMPPAIYGQRVPDSHIETLRRWIAGGAASDQASESADKPATEQRARFEKDLLPLFTTRCVRCHGEVKPMAGLDLRTAASVLKGSSSGPIIVEGFSERSLLIRRVASHSMPPEGAGQPLNEAEIRLMREWIDRGHFTEVEAENPADRPFTPSEAPPVTAEQRQFWAFRKPVSAPVPKPRSGGRVRTPIDAFLLAKLESQGFGFSADASNSTLMRRAYFDLTGLPPTPEQVRTFLADTRPDAYERLIDRLLSSPRYGERWGRTWLDAAGYVDTTGKDFDPTKTEYADGMWHYRDYVIRSVNDDKPWDRFLTEQLAGDEMVDWRSAKTFSPETVELLTATGYLRNILDITEEDISNLPVERYEALFKLVEKVSSSTLGLTVGCARCHSHKFDPIPQRDYYRLLSIFTTAYNPTDWLQPQNRYLWSVSKEEKEEIDRYNGEIDRPVGELAKQLAALRKPYQQRILDEKLKVLPEAIREDARAALDIPKEKRDDVQKYLFAKFGASLKVGDAEVSKSLNEADRAAAEKLQTQIHVWDGYRRRIEKLQALWDVGAPPAIRLLQRGSAESPGPKVTPGFLEVLCSPGNADAVRPGEAQGKTSGLRLAFARWLTSRENPVGARVIVNRIWQGHFGTGIVATPDNFGKMGAAPSNQELLDWLAVDFMEHGWKAKRLHKAIMMSTAYRQASLQVGEPWMAKAKIADPENRLLWRMNLRRLDAETLRDSVIAVAGKLDTTMGGPPIKLSMQPDGLQIVSREEPPSSQWRRSIYLTARRTYPLTFLNVFDFPAIDTNCTRRSPSATPLQSLTMINDRFVLESAGYFAARVGEIAGNNAPAAKKIEAAYLLAFARKPRAVEIQMAEAHLQKQQGIYLTANEPASQASAKALLNLAQMLLSSNEFLYID